jgi:phage recombination protein Bet
MTVPQREMKVASADDKEMRFVPFASDTEIKLTVAIVTNLICIPTRNGHRCTPQDAIKFMMMCQARKLNPFEGDAFLQGYDSSNGPTFNLITAHQAFLKRAEVNEQYDGMESGVVLLNGNGEISELQGDFYPEGHKLVGGWARVHLKHRKIPMYRRLALDVFRKVNREGKPYGRWADDPAGMIVKCAEADALRSAFPTMLGNLYLEQELNPGEKNVTPAPKIDAPPFMAPSLPASAPTAQPDRDAATPTGPTEKDDQHHLERDTPEPAPTTPPPAEEPKRDVTEGLEPADVLTLLTQLMKKDGVSEDQVLGHLKNTKVAKSNQTELPQLADSKLRTLANDWDKQLAAIKAVTV